MYHLDMNAESFGGPKVSFDDSADAVSNTLEITMNVMEAAGRQLDTGLKLAGITKPALNIIRDLNRYSEKPVLSWFLKLPAVKMLQVAMVAGQVISGGPAKAEDFAKAVNTTYQLTQSAQKIKSLEITRDLKSSEAPNVKLQHFLDGIRGPATKLRQKFENTGDPVKDQAWRVALANVFTPYENRITAERLMDNPEYNEKVREILGAPTTLEDILRGTDLPAYKQDYPKFKTQIFEIYKDPEFANLQHEIWDSRLFFYYEILDGANEDQPEHEQYRKDNKELIDEAVAYFKKDKNLEAVMDFMDTAEFVRENKKGQHVPLDIPEKLQN